MQLFLRNLVVVDRLLLLDPALGLGAAVQTRLQINLLLLRGGQQVLLRQQDQAVLVRLSHLVFCDVLAHLRADAVTRRQPRKRQLLLC